MSKKLFGGNLHGVNKERNKGKKGKEGLKKRRTNREMECSPLSYSRQVSYLRYVIKFE